MGYLDKTGLNKVFTKLKSLIDGKSDKGHTHDYTVGVPTEGTGGVYTATISGITSLEKGMTITIVPHTNSTRMIPSLNVNGLGEKYVYIKDGASYSGGTTCPPVSKDLFISDIPVSLTYNGSEWIADLCTPHAAELEGQVSITHGGTGAANPANARANLGITSGTSAPPSTGEEGSIYIQYEE